LGREIHQRLGRIARRGRKRVFAVIARSEATKQSILSLRLDGLLRCARNDGSTTPSITLFLRATEATSGYGPFLPTTSWVVNLRSERLLTFADTIAISTPPGTTSGLLPLDGICE
jgi:hypothetical protein